MLTHATLLLALTASATGTALLPASDHGALPGTELRPTGGIEWFGGSFEEALKSASDKDQMVLLYFWAESSETCGKFQQETFGDARAVHPMADFVCVGANTARTDGYALVQRYNVRTLPTVLFVRGDGEVEDAVVGFIEPQGFADELARIRRGEKTVSDFRKQVKKSPKDLDLQYTLAIKLMDIGNEGGHDEVVEKIKKADPRGKNLVAARLHLDAARKDAVKNAMDDHGNFSYPDAVNLKPVLTQLKKTKHDELAFEGWLWVAEVKKMSEQPQEARAAAMTAWEYRPTDNAIVLRDYSNKIAHMMMHAAEELDANEKAFALEVSLAAYDAFEKVISGDCGCDPGCSCLETDDGGLITEAEWFPKWKAEYLGTVASAYDLNGQADQAVAAAERMLVLLPDSEEVEKRLEDYRSRL